MNSNRSRFQTETANNPTFQVVTLAIEKLMEENKNDEASENADDRLLLARLLSQVELLKSEEMEELRRSSVSDSAESEEIDFAADEQSEAAMKRACGCGEIDNGKDEIVKELKKLRKQNFVTHCLLSAMIVLTVAWQLSEVSLILKVKNSLTNPFQMLGGLLRGVIRRPEIHGLEEDKSQNQSEAPVISLPPLKLPDLPVVQLPDLIFDSEKH